MASYSANIIDANPAGGGPWSLTLFRNPTTAASGGTQITPPWIENDNGGSSGAQATSSLVPYTVVVAALRSINDDRAVNGD